MSTQSNPSTIGGAYSLQPGEGEVLNVVGDFNRILADSRATGGACTIMETRIGPGIGPPLHRHGREDEYLFVIEGKVKFVIDGRELTLSAGGFVFAPRGSVHAFRNVSESESRMLVVAMPGGIEVPFRVADELTRAGRASLETLAPAFAKIGLELLGPPLGP